jgi:predicted membrane protein
MSATILPAAFLQVATTGYTSFQTYDKILLKILVLLCIFHFKSRKNFAFILRLSFLHIHMSAEFNVCIFFETARAHTAKEKKEERKKKDMNDKHQKNT